MSLFTSILGKLGIGGPSDAAPAETTTPAEDTASTEERAPIAPPTAPDIPAVDVMSQMESLAAANPQKLNWRTSIVDLLKLLNLDSSFGARKEMAAELGCPGDKMSDSAQMNVWLHKTVLRKISENGGNIPKDLLD